MISSKLRTILSLEEARERAASYAKVVGQAADDFRGRRARGEKHPVDDFLFTYYPHRPGLLARWHPGVGVGVEAGCHDDIPSHLRRNPYRCEDGILWAEPKFEGDGFARRLESGLEILEGTLLRTPSFGCFGLHEWAMVYGVAPDDVRHGGVPLRVSPTEIAKLVDAHALCCTHYDAYRFFTDDPAAANSLKPTLESRSSLEQPGCLHTNMDLYKYAYKLKAMCPSELMADCFSLAAEIRKTDMAASPYDLSACGLEPVAIETAEGRAEYQSRQRDFATRAIPLRKRLIEVYRLTLDLIPAATGA